MLPSPPHASLYADDAVLLADVHLQCQIKHTTLHLHTSTDTFNMGALVKISPVSFDCGYSNVVNLHEEPGFCQEIVCVHPHSIDLCLNPGTPGEEHGKGKVTVHVAITVWFNSLE